MLAFAGYRICVSKIIYLQLRCVGLVLFVVSSILFPQRASIHCNNYALHLQLYTYILILLSHVCDIALLLRF